MVRRARLAKLARQEGLGEIVGIVRGTFIWVPLFIFSPLLLLAFVTVREVMRGEDWRIAALFWAILLLIVTYFWKLLTAERLVVAEGGLLMGSLIAGLRPFRIRWSEIDPASVAFLTHLKGLQSLYGQSMSSSRRAHRWHATALSFAGPSIEAARLPGFWPSSPAPDETTTGGALWYYGCTHRQGQKIAALLGETFARQPGVNPDALRTQLTNPITLSDDPAEVVGQVPGLIRVLSR